MGNAIIAETAIKRKRKAPADEEFGSSNIDGLSTPAERARVRSNQQQNAPTYSILSLFTEKELAMHSNHAHVAALHFLSTSKRAKQAASSQGGMGEGEEGAVSGDTSGQEDSGAPEMERTASQSVHATRSTRNTNGTTAGLNLLGELTDKNATRPNLPYFILGNYHQRPNGSGSAPPPPPLMPEEIEDDLARIEKLKKTKPPGWIDTRLVNHLLDTLVPPEKDDVGVSCERFSSLHPDFPREMDVHLVRAYARNDD